MWADDQKTWNVFLLAKFIGPSLVVWAFWKVVNKKEIKKKKEEGDKWFCPKKNLNAFFQLARVVLFTELQRCMIEVQELFDRK